MIGDILHRLSLLHDDEVSERESQEEVSYLLAAVLGLSSAVWVYFGYTVDERQRQGRKVRAPVIAEIFFRAMGL